MALQIPLAAVLLLLSAASSTVKTAAAAHALPGCSDKCGDLTIPYPFGMEERCSLGREFFINCSNTSDTTQPPTAYLMDSNIIVTNISLEVGEMQISKLIGRDCYDKEGNRTDVITAGGFRLVPPYTISDARNKFYAVGCDTYAEMQGFQGEEEVITGCISICNSLSSVNENSCSGIGCCQINIPSGLTNLTFGLSSYYRHKNVSEFNPCSYAFIAEQGKFNFSSSSFEHLNGIERLPMVLNWAIVNDSDTCDEAQNRKGSACMANSKCFNPAIDESVGYLCQCLPGYEGNPYHPDGCQDIDECKDPNICQNGECLNLLPPQNYTCSSCHKGYKKDKTNDKSCIEDHSSKIVLLLIVSLGVSMGLLVFILGISWICWGMKKREFIKLKEKHFKENGGLLLLQRLASHGSSMKTTKIFTAEELEKATDNYHDSGVLGEGGYGTVYKGILSDDTVVAIKKSKGIAGPTQSDQFVNEVIVLSQINHRNVVKLLGCCLETEVPLLVYEFITHGTLYEHIHKKRSSLSFELRMKIATESAEALSHLHSSISTPIIHRDVKTANILLDDECTAKVSDFGASRLVPSGQHDIQTLVLGTFGYLDPEYMQSNQLTEKSDVYSFGVVLVELLTSKVPISKDRYLTSIFLASMEEDWLDQILDHDIVNEGNIETVKKVANLAKRCLRVKGEERPTMKEVAKELEELRVTVKHPWIFNASFPEGENEYLLESLNSDSYVVGVEGDCSSSGLTSDTANAYDSMQKQVELTPYGGGR